MYYYRIAEVVLQSCYRLSSFGKFACDPAKADMVLSGTEKIPPAGTDQQSGAIIHRCLPDGWFFKAQHVESKGLYVSKDYRKLQVLGEKGTDIFGMSERLIRIALECFLARCGYVSLHSAAVETDGEAYAFTGPSGMGKSTRAAAWISIGDAKLISGDRPLIDVRKTELYGVPWDGKEQCFRNVRFPLKAICEVRRSDTVYVRAMNFSQRRKLLMRQCFLPMWDTETATIQMANITHLAMSADIFRVFSGPSGEDVMALKRAIHENHILKEEPDMKAKSGFILRNVVDEYILMPTGDNIGRFNGTVLLNEVSALVWEKLQNPVSREDLIQAILDEFEVEKAVAAADLDALLEKLKDFGVIEDD